MTGEHTAACKTVAEHDRELPDVDLLSPLQIRGMKLNNRIVMSPMCQYIAQDGMASDWHLVHLGSRASGGTGLIIVEATGVKPEGRITPGCMGIWSDAHIAPLARIVDFVHSQGAKIGIQLAHAGRKASCDVPWHGGKALTPDQGAWTAVAPSAIPFYETDPVPHALTLSEIKDVQQAFGDAIRRALTAGFDLIEIHSAHGYLSHSFLSPLSNQRTDQYGGSLENRMRFVTELATQAREIIPADMPLFTRISATDWVEGGWTIEDSVILARQLATVGVDLIDVSSGGAVPHASIPVSKGFQVPLASQVRREANVKTGAVGLITEPNEANDIICRGDADLVFLGRQLLREPYWAERAMTELGAEQKWPISYGYAVKRRS
jgi:2,4-dienoyl-CoA reductase-like NADH-dependent reductase (Old Yellow Enzyme family)